MKTFLLLFAASFTLNFANAQYTQNFEGSESDLTSNCSTLSGLHITNSPGMVITGNGSLYSDPIVTPAPTDLIFPALNITSTNFTVSFNYDLTNKLNGSAVRLIEVGLLSQTGVFTSLQVITLDNSTPTSVQNFNQSFTLASTGVYKLVFRLSGSVGDGNTRLIFDDISTNASALYGAGTCNSAPVALNDVFFRAPGSVVTGNVISNDSDPNGEAIQAILVADSPHGTLVFNADGSFVFTVNPNYSGTTVTFTYQVIDNGFGPAVSNTATVTIIYSAGASLPVKLTSFTAQLSSNNKVDLKWSTATEINASHFVIERSVDGKTYNELGIEFAAGNSTSVKNYQYTDNIGSTDKTVYYYRLRMVDADGSSEYSAVRIIRIGKQNETIVTILTYPNPVTSEVRITIPANWQGKKATYEVVNANGQTAKRTEVANASQTETLNTSSLAPGFYLLRVTCDNATAIQKIIKQ